MPTNTKKQQPNQKSAGADDDLQNKYNLSYCFISHDLNLIRKICHRTYVMKDSRIVEEGLTCNIFKQPKDVYTQELLESSFISY